MLIKRQHAPEMEFLVVSLPPTISNSMFPKNSFGGMFLVASLCARIEMRSLPFSERPARLSRPHQNTQSISKVLETLLEAFQIRQGSQCFQRCQTNKSVYVDPPAEHQIMSQASALLVLLILTEPN